MHFHVRLIRCIIIFKIDKRRMLSHAVDININKYCCLLRIFCAPRGIILTGRLSGSANGRFSQLLLFCLDIYTDQYVIYYYIVLFLYPTTKWQFATVVVLSLSVTLFYHPNDWSKYKLRYKSTSEFITFLYRYTAHVYTYCNNIVI